MLRVGLHQEQIETLPQLLRRAQEPNVEEAGSADEWIVASADKLMACEELIRPHKCVDLSLREPHEHKAIEAAEEGRGDTIGADDPRIRILDVLEDLAEHLFEGVHLLKLSKVRRLLYIIAQQVRQVCAMVVAIDGELPVRFDQLANRHLLLSSLRTPCSSLGFSTAGVEHLELLFDKLAPNLLAFTTLWLNYAAFSQFKREALI